MAYVGLITLHKQETDPFSYHSKDSAKNFIWHLLTLLKNPQ
jgi:hypothetical protein